MAFHDNAATKPRHHHDIDMNPGLQAPAMGEPPRRLCAWIGDIAAMISILGLIPLAMATLTVWLDIQ